MFENQKLKSLNAVKSVKFLTNQLRYKFNHSSDYTMQKIIVEQIETLEPLYTERDYKDYENYRKKNQRARSRIEKIISSEKALFLTFTFTDKALQTTSENTRYQGVVRWLKSNCLDYVANIDYGNEHSREHYHAVVSVNKKIDYTSWRYGALNGVKIKRSSSPLALAKYLNKLVNHAFKSSNNSKKIIYARQTKKDVL